MNQIYLFRTLFHITWWAIPLKRLQYDYLSDESQHRLSLFTCNVAKNNSSDTQTACHVHCLCPKWLLRMMDHRLQYCTDILVVTLNKSTFRYIYIRARNGICCTVRPDYTSKCKFCPSNLEFPPQSNTKD